MTKLMETIIKTTDVSQTLHFSITTKMMLCHELWRDFNYTILRCRFLKETFFERKDPLRIVDKISKIHHAVDASRDCT